MLMKKIITPIILSTLLFSTFVLVNSNKEIKPTEAAAPANYYSSITSSMKGDTLKEALYNIIKGHIQRSYDSLENDMKVTDRDYTLSPLGTDDDNPYMNLLYANYNFNASTARYWGDSDGSFYTSGSRFGTKNIFGLKQMVLTLKGSPLIVISTT